MNEKSGVLIDKARLSSMDLGRLKSSLTLWTSPMKGDPEKVVCYEESESHIWVPRHFEPSSVDIGPAPLGDSVVASMPEFKLDLIEDRGQPQAFDAMVKYLSKNQGGILQAFTGFGKTIVGLAIAASFKTPIGIMVYAEHMMENWIEHIELCFGLTRDEIGVVRGERCDVGKPITIMMVQSLYSSREYPPELYSQVGFILADEVHRYGAPVWQSVLAQFPARYRMGMSADPTRADGLGEIIEWNFGKVAHTVKKTAKIAKPRVIQVCYETTYKLRSYCSFFGGLPGDPDLMRYRKCITRDEGRNAMIVNEMVKARLTGRRCLVFAHERIHLFNLLTAFERALEASESAPETACALFVSKGKSKGEPPDLKDRVAKIDEALAADMVFTTYGMARAAFNKPDLDTLFMVTPIGNVLQALGRLRDKGPEDRRPLLVIDPFERTEYSEERAVRRQDEYIGLGCKVDVVSRKKVSVPRKNKRRKGGRSGTKR